jgi:hypothetical protein
LFKGAEYLFFFRINTSSKKRQQLLINVNDTDIQGEYTNSIRNDTDYSENSVGRGLEDLKVTEIAQQLCSSGDAYDLYSGHGRFKS